MNSRIQLYSLKLLLIFTSLSFGQSDQNDLKIFGFFQSSFYLHSSQIKYTNPPAPKYEQNSNSFWQQQLNLLMSKNFGTDFTAFVNFKLTNSYSSDFNWGSFELHEAWFKYKYSEALNIKGGLMLARVFRLNEIKDRTILFPYIVRPLVYEEALDGVIPLYAFVPEQVNIQLYGVFNAGGVKLDYTLLAGNSGAAYRVSRGAMVSGYASSVDTTTSKLFGGRFGLQAGDLTLGTTITFDRSNQRDMGLGDLQRTRIGADIAYSAGNFNFEGEFISVIHSLNNGQKAMIKFLSDTDPKIGPGIDKLFYYGNLTYNINEEFYVYLKYDYLKDEIDGKLNEGMVSYSLGGGYRPNDSIVLKTQFIRYNYNSKRYIDSSSNMFLIGASVFF